MYCKYCGAELPEGSRFCGSCSATLYEIDQVKKEKTPDAKKKRLLKTALVLLTAVIILSVLGTISAFLFREQMTNLLVGLSSPQTQQLYAYQRLADKTSDRYGNIINMIKGEHGGRGNITLEPGSKTDGILYSLVPELADTKPIDIEYDANISEDIMSLDITAYSDNTEIIAAGTVADFKNNQVTISLPTLNDYALKAELSELSYEGTNSLFDYLSAVKRLPDSELARRLMSDYLRIALEKTSGVKRSTDIFSIGDVKTEAVLFTTHITRSTAGDILSAVTKEAREDKELKEYILELYGDDGDKIYNEIFENSDQKINDLKNDPSSDEIICTLKTWSDSSYNIIAAELSADNTLLFLAELEHNGIYAAELTRNTGKSHYSITAQGKTDQSRFTGTVLLKNAGKTLIKAECNEVEPKSSGFTGEVTLSGKALTSAEYITLIGSTKNDQSIYELSVFGDDTALRSAAITYTPHKFSKPRLHKNATEDIQQWLSGLDPEVLMRLALTKDEPEDTPEPITEETEQSIETSDSTNEYQLGYTAGYADGYMDGLYGDSYAKSYGANLLNPTSDEYTRGYADGYNDGYNSIYGSGVTQ
ncbi:MAG: hypothetical protein IKT46_08090 [Clostridia bacterium]|nr:hypothetical protein [Clostridia bacterium]